LLLGERFQELTHTQDLDPFGEQKPHQIPIPFQIVIAGHQSIGAAVPRGLDHHIVIGVSTELKGARNRCHLSPFAQQSCELSNIPFGDPVPSRESRASEHLHQLD
jgi:hypothetical protein